MIKTYRGGIKDILLENKNDFNNIMMFFDDSGVWPDDLYSDLLEAYPKARQDFEKSVTQRRKNKVENWLAGKEYHSYSVNQKGQIFKAGDLSCDMGIVAYKENKGSRSINYKLLMKFLEPRQMDTILMVSLAKARGKNKNANLYVPRFDSESWGCPWSVFVNMILDFYDRLDAVFYIEETEANK